MSIELAAWTAIKTALKSSAVLAPFVKTFRFYRTAFQFDPKQHPILMAWPESIDDNKFIGIPKRKIPDLTIVLTGIVMAQGEALEDTLLQFDELIKNAIETDLQLGGAATIAKINRTEFHGLSEGVAMLQITVPITTNILTAGSR